MTRARRHINISLLLAVVVLLSPSFLLSSCSSGDDGMNEPTPQDKQEIRFNPGVWNFMEGTRASTFDSQSDLQTEAHFYCAVYNAGTLTSYITPGQVSYANTQWTFDSGKHYWPASDDLDFYAYAPFGGVGYITSGPSYSVVSSTPQMDFTCSLPMTHAGQDNTLKEFVYDIQTGRNKSNSSLGVALSFKHPFARIILKLSSTQANICINKITLKGMKSGGTYSSVGPTWSSLTPAGTVDFEAALNKDCEANEVLGTYLMIPQNWAGAIEVEATWTDWGDQLKHYVTASVPTDWEPGKSYTYTFTITETDLIVDSTKYTEQW